MQSISDITFQDAVNAFVLQYRGERLKKIFGSLRLDNDWITINGTHVLVDKDGNALSGGKLVGKNFKDAKSQKKVSVKRTEAQSKTLGKIIKKTANLKKEQYRIIDKDGNVLLEKKGDKSSVASTVGEHRENLPGNISIHNHPEGGTFSTADLSDFGYGAQEIVVASPEGTYSLVNTRMGQPDQFDGWIPLRDAIEKDIPEQSPFDNLKKARENLKDSPEMKQMKSIEGEWLEWPAKNGGSFNYDGLIHHADNGEIKTLIAFESNQFKNRDNVNPTENADIRYSSRDTNTTENTRRIREKMPSEERAEILRHKTISVPRITSRRVDDATSREIAANANKLTDIKKTMKRVAEDFGIIGKQYFNEDAQYSLELSKRKIEESVQKQKKEKYADFALMLSCFKDIAENAIEIEVHNKNDEGYKEDITLKEMRVLVSAFEEGDRIIPVKIELKEFTDKPTSVHVILALSDIKKSDIKRQQVVNDDVAGYPPSLFSKYSVPQILSAINSEDKDFVKYIPDEFRNVAEAWMTRQKWWIVQQKTWEKIQNEGKTLKEIIYQEDVKRTVTDAEINEIKKNRVTAARYGSTDPSANTSETVQRSPLFDNIIPQENAAGQEQKSARTADKETGDRKLEWPAKNGGSFNNM